ncbi:MAG: phosphatidate cytidylyltransferase [Candidatus Competibacterales bacterium]
MLSPRPSIRPGIGNPDAHGDPGMLWRRLATGMLLAIAVGGGILTLPTAGFGVMLLVFIAVGAFEWGTLIRLSHPMAPWLYGAGVVLAIVALWPWQALQGVWWTVMAAAAGYWFIGVPWVLWRASPAVHPRWWWWAVAGVVTLVAPWMALMALHHHPDHGPLWVLFVMFLVWLIDTLAFFAGRCLGHSRVAPWVRPAKTLEGVTVALLGALAFSVLGAWWLGLSRQCWPWFVVVCGVTAVFAVLGDLVESLLKRHRGVKQSGGLLPGHGGVLDRVDSLTAAAPVFVMGVYMILGDSVVEGGP